MDIITGALIIIGTLLAAVFNYYLNRAPGSDPEDFQLGPPELNITCDCYLNTIIVSAVAVVALMTASAHFSSIWEMVLFGSVVFIVITLAGVLGRHHRYQEWKLLTRAIFRAVPTVSKKRPGSIDLSFDEDDDEPL